MVQLLRLWLGLVLVIRKTPACVAKTQLRSMCCFFQALPPLRREKKKVLFPLGSSIYIYQLPRSSLTVANTVLNKPGFQQDGCPAARQQPDCRPQHFPSPARCQGHPRLSAVKPQQSCTATDSQGHRHVTDSSVITCWQLF